MKNEKLNDAVCDMGIFLKINDTWLMIDFTQIPPICSIIKGKQIILSLIRKQNKAKFGHNHLPYASILLWHIFSLYSVCT